MMPDQNGYYAGSEFLPDYTSDQPVYYSLTPGYGYYGLGYESPGEWSDPSAHFAVDGQNLQYSGLQTEDVPYLYYTPGYGYTYPSPDQYAPYQQYMATPTYHSQTQIPPPSYVPVVMNDFGSYASLVAFDPSSNFTGNNITGSSSRLVNNGDAKGRHHTSTSGTISPVSLVTGASRSSNQSQVMNKPPLIGSIVANGSARDNLVGNARSTNHLSQAFRNNLKISSHSTSTKSGESQTDQNKGTARIARSNTAKEKSHLSLSHENKNAIYIDTQQFNADEFPVDYEIAKFYIIKSYSEDDVHKSIKYGVWSSTPNGNRRLDAAYTDAQSKSTENPNGCPVFLFFSVNASGQFCGVAEMVGPVDFNKDMEFWQQDKWSGSFPVKWHVIKDVLNATFRHITLHNNENKPVTNSRDTQEVPYDVGITMLKIFKTTPLTSSVLEDFPFYEARQQAMIQEKCRRTGRSYDASLYTPAIIVNTRSATDQPAVVNTRPAVDQPAVVNTRSAVDQRPAEKELASTNVQSDAKDDKQSEDLTESSVQCNVQLEEVKNGKQSKDSNAELKVGSVRIKVMESASEVVDMGTASQK